MGPVCQSRQVAWLDGCQMSYIAYVQRTCSVGVEVRKGVAKELGLGGQCFQMLAEGDCGSFADPAPGLNGDREPELQENGKM